MSCEMDREPGLSGGQGVGNCELKSVPKDALDYWFEAFVLAGLRAPCWQRGSRGQPVAVGLGHIQLRARHSTEVSVSVRNPA